MKIKKRKLVPKRSDWRCLRDKNHPDKVLLRDGLDYLIAHISKKADLAFFTERTIHNILESFDNSPVLFLYFHQFLSKMANLVLSL